MKRISLPYYNYTYISTLAIVFLTKWCVSYVNLVVTLTKYLFRAYTAWSNGHQSKHGNKEIFGESRAIKTCFLFFFSGKNDSVKGQVNLILTFPHHPIFQVYSLLSLPGSIHRHDFDVK